MNDANLPAHRGIDVRIFSRVLDDTTTANKFLWLLALLKVAESRDSAAIPFRDISREMVNFAVAPVYEFKLSFGGSDRTKEYLDRIFQTNGALDGTLNVVDKGFSEPLFDKVRGVMEKYVPYRLLTPFFESQLKGLKDCDKNGRIAKLAADGFGGKCPPPYRFVGAGKNAAVEIHPRWRDYFLANMAIVRGWVRWNWAAFLQDRNPSIPGIINKIQNASPERLMTKQRDFWRAVVRFRGGHAVCIYSGRRIAFAETDIDHYIPWSFIGHSHLWNLAPVHQEVNRSKGNRIPANKYLSALVRVQRDALTIHRRHFPHKFKKLIDPYYADLRLSPSELTDEDALHNAYKKTVAPLVAIAANSQFATGWAWNKK